MNTEKKSEAVKLLEKLNGGPLTLGQLLQAHRLSADLTQEKMAKRLGISRVHLCQIEIGKSFLSPDRAQVFAKKLGYLPELLISLSLQDQLDRAGIRLRVRLEAA